MKKPTNRLFLKGIFLTVALSLIFASVPLQPVLAVPADTIGGPIAVIKKALETVKEKLIKAWDKVGANLFQTTITNALKRIAYDTATWIGSGDNGQKPLFLTGEPGKYLTDLADAAAGDFIDAFAAETNINFCQPNLDVKVKIGLGLNAKGTGMPNKPACTASSMFKAWKTDINAKYAAMTDPHFLQNMTSMFDVGGSDISVGLDVMDGLNQTVSKKTEDVKQQLGIGGGWLSKENIGGQITEPPGTAARELDVSAQTTADAQKVSPTKSVLTDVSKVFLNTLATTALNKALKNLAAGDWSALTYGLYKGKSDDEVAALIASGGTNAIADNASCLNDPNCDPSVHRGAFAVKAGLSDMIKPTFDSRGDYDILGELGVCTDPNNPGPTNCILDTQFSSAISEHKTVIEAINEGFLNKSWRLKRDIDFNQGYSLRALMVLRKYRIIPVGWETALLKAEENEANVTLMDMVSCFDPNDNYNEFSQGFTPSAWCQGLIDPNWVLKAPLNYCKRQGYGNQILDKTVTPSQTVAGEEIPGDVIVTRADEYCADEQSCIKEKADGTCEAYGYCTEEKRTWDFTADSCDAVNNTCQAFIKSNGATASYLENTVDYSTCNADNAGCRPYALSGSYTSSTDKINWNATNHIYFSKKAEACDASQEGCNELIRITPEVGHNFLINSDFEQSLDNGSWNVNIDDANVSSVNTATTTADGYFSTASLSLGSSGVLKKNVAVGPNDYNISGRTYTFSFYAKNCTGLGNQAVLGNATVDNKTLDLGQSTDWNYYSLTYNFPLGLTDNHVYISINSNSCQIDRLKLELAKVGTEYSDYYQNNLVYQKLIPDYLATACYINPNSATPDYRLRADAPFKCSSYTRRCNASEVDCDIYQSVRDGFTLPAKTTPFDACFAECDGYDSYIQKTNAFYNASAANFIPNTATKCSANVVGCSEFTNLDAVAQGGEGKEYYSAMRRCIKPDNNVCGVFYSWGSSNAGYQLQPFKLQAFNDKPELTADGFDANNNEIDANQNIICSEAIFNAPLSDPAYNADCRQLYNKDGVIFYALYSKTVTCSDDCHPYRISETPIDESINDSANCTGPDKHWDGANNLCNVCNNNGVWDDNQNGCIYQAIPGEGKTCSASENGCREYNGNYGNNLRIVKTYDFEFKQIWASYCNDASVLNVDSINKNGHSLQYNYSGGSCGTNNFNLNPITVSSAWHDTNVFAVIKSFWNRVIKGAEAQTGNALPGHGVGITVGQNVKQNSAYVLRFLAKASANVSASFYLANGTVASQFDVNTQNNGAVAISGNNEWKMYSMNLASLDHEVTDQEALIFSATGGVLIDNITLTEVTDRFYLIKDSWATPDSCYYDTFDTYQGTNYNLGCSAYTNRAGDKSYLRNFSHLCQDSSAGCELMSLTNNSANPSAQAFQELGTPNNQCNPGDGVSCVAVPADKMVYVVFDEAKQCGVENKGCSRLGGQTATNLDVTVQSLYSDVYLKNNPDKYDSILCQDSEVGCDEWKYLSGQSSYFKDPGKNVCEWRQPLNATGMNLPKKWYKRQVGRCDLNDNGTIDANIMTGTVTEAQNILCNVDNDCPAGSCIMDSNDYLCDVSSLKTIGTGGGNLVYQPSNMVGACTADASGCTEYIDPVSEFSPNIVINPDWGDVNKDGISGDSWSTSTDAGFTGLQKQVIYLVKNKLYSFSVEASSLPSQNTTLVCPASVRILSSDNAFAPAATSIVVTPATSKNILFNSLNNVSCTLYGGHSGKTINIRGTIVDYKLLAGVDKTTCNGSTSFDNGCILFNERKQNGGNGLSALGWKAYGGSYLIGSPVSSTSDGDSNVLVKVKPNRVCSKWLSCMSMGVDSATGEEVCYALGECDKLNDVGRCQSFVNKPEIQHTFDSGSDRNIAGYSKMDNYYLSNMFEVGEDTSNNWNFDSTSTPDIVLQDVNNKAVIDSRGIVGISYPAVGLGLARIGSTAELSNFQVLQGKEYFVNFLVNIDATTGLGGELRIYVGGVLSTSTLINSGSGWQRRVLRFVPASTAAASIKLFNNSTINSPTYFDDISIEPVLKVSDNSYIAKECRLYPKQDSLSCKSDNTGITANGIYGYCLEHDPKNPDVCIMWYPIDNVKSSQASVGTFSGYNLKPKYCAETDINFAFVEKRSSYIAFDGETNSSCGACSSCPDDDDLTVSGDQAPWNGITCGSSDYWLHISHIKSCSGTNHVHTCAICYPKDISSTRLASVAGPTLTCSNSTGYSYTFGNNGWYIFNGFAGTESSNATPNVQLWDYDDTSAGVQDPAAYDPKCSVYVEADRAWVKRVTILATSSIPYVNTEYLSALAPYKNYYLTTGSMTPYGVTADPTVGNAIGSLGGAPYACNDHGKTYRNSSGSTVRLCNSIINSNSNYSDFKVSYSSGLNMAQVDADAAGTPATALKRLKNTFLKFKWNGITYDYASPYVGGDPVSAGAKITPCSGTGDDRNISNSLPSAWCSVYPKIYNIKLRDSEGHEIQNVNNSYNITTADYYTISFGVTIDPEQLPVGRLLINFGDNTGDLDITQIDPSTNYNFIHYYSPQVGSAQTKIRIKVEDNWGLFKCSGLANNTVNCAKTCCQNDFSPTNTGCVLGSCLN